MKAKKKHDRANQRSWLLSALERQITLDSERPLLRHYEGGEAQGIMNDLKLVPGVLDVQVSHTLPLESSSGSFAATAFITSCVPSTMGAHIL